MADLFMIEDLRTKMKTDVVCFTYRKNDGSIRYAYGTLNNEIIDEHLAKQPVTGKPKRKRPGYPDSVFPYFDLEKFAWRCFRKDALMDVSNDYGF